MIGVATQPRAWSPVDADLDTLATALYVTIDELLQHALGWPRGARPWGSRPRSATPNWSPWRSSKPCSASPPKPAGWAPPTASCATCSRSCPANLAITSACAAPPSCCATPSAPSPPTPPCRPTRSGSSTPPRWSAAARGKPPSAPSLQGGRRTAGAPAIRAGLGPATAPGLHPAGVAGLVRVDRRQGRRSGGATGPADRCTADGGCSAGAAVLADKHHYGREFEDVLAGLGCGCCDRPARARPSGLAHDCFGRCGS